MIPSLPINFTPPGDLIEALIHSTDGYHVVIGLDPLGTFTSVSGLGAQNPSFTYNELGRNRSPVVMPHSGPRTYGQVTLEWGTVVRTKFWNWVQEQSPNGLWTHHVYILHMSRRSLPIRVFMLYDAWPVSWSYSDLGHNEVAVESVVLAYDRMVMFNLAPLTVFSEMMGDLETRGGGPPPAETRRGSFPPEDKVPTAYTGDVGTWDREAVPEDYVAEVGEWIVTKLPEDYTAAVGEWGTYEPLEEDYEAVPGSSYTEALEETYVTAVGEWGGEDE